MKIKGWIAITALLALNLTATAHAAEASNTPLQETFSHLEKAIQNTKTSASGASRSARWSELEHFQTSLWRAMALDPSSVATVPVNEVPKNLFANEINDDLAKQLEDLKKSSKPKEFGVEAEFSQYLSTVQNILSLRKARQFPQARAIAKRGILDNRFDPLAKKFSDEGTFDPKEAWAEIEAETRNVKEQIESRDSFKTNVFGGSNPFVWYAVCALAGFLFGIAGIRIHPDFFRKFAETLDFTTPSATTHSGGVRKLDYAQWLREFEEILSRLKSSQLSHERRIEDLVSTSEKISQQLYSLASDSRIKSEANLEFRMSSVVKGMQSQIDLGQRLQGGDRVQINLMLEHCLNLCDAIENGRVHFDGLRNLDPPAMKTA